MSCITNCFKKKTIHIEVERPATPPAVQREASRVSLAASIPSAGSQASKATLIEVAPKAKDKRIENLIREDETSDKENVHTDLKVAEIAQKVMATHTSF